MRKLITLIFMFILVGVIIIPALVVSNYRLFEETPPVVDTKQRTIPVFFHETGETKVVPMEEYLVGVLAAEMPAEFEMEALKAQAVAARTYTLKKLSLGNTREEHKNAPICTEPNHCQGWMSSLQMKERWGMFNYIKYKSKIEEAVRATEGMVLTYQGRLIEPVYHSTSSGRTENSEDVWLNAIPYLRSVNSPWDTESPRYQESKTLTLRQIDETLGTNLRALPVSAMQGTNSQAIRVLEKTSSGRVKKLYIDGKTVMGTEFRRALALNSTHFTWTIQGDRITFLTTGFGHGVGMSQWGANGMAKAGATYEQILKHYYTGVELEKLEPQ